MLPDPRLNDGMVWADENGQLKVCINGEWKGLGFENPTNNTSINKQILKRQNADIYWWELH